MIVDLHGQILLAGDVLSEHSKSKHHRDQMHPQIRLHRLDPSKGRLAGNAHQDGRL
jgi:hypothetical protein